MMEKYYDIERAAGALAKFPRQKSDLKDFTWKIENNESTYI